jgi:hypothetical protein
MSWDDPRRVLKLRLAAGSRMLPPDLRTLIVRLGRVTHPAIFDGRPLELKF